MSTSSTYTLTVTALSMAKSISRVVAGERNPKANEIKDIIEAINYSLFQLQEPQFQLKPGDFIWQRETTDLTLSSKSEYDLKPSGGDADIQIPIEIITATLKDTDSNETPLVPMDIYEYQEISNKTDTGTPLQYYYERRLDTGKLYLNCVPSDTSYVIDLVYRQPLEIITDTADEFDLPNYFYRLLKYEVAVEIAPEYRVDSETFQGLVLLRNEARDFVNSIHPENSNDYFQPGVH